jgi:hypothetical protein
VASLFISKILRKIQVYSVERNAASYHPNAGEHIVTTVLQSASRYLRCINAFTCFAILYIVSFYSIRDYARPAEGSRVRVTQCRLGYIQLCGHTGHTECGAKSSQLDTAECSGLTNGFGIWSEDIYYLLYFSRQGWIWNYVKEIGNAHAQPHANG